MDLFNVNGLPLHVLLVHVIVLLVPATALCVVLAAVWPAARRRLGLVTPLFGLATIALVPLTMASGQWLKDRVFGTPLIETHAALGAALWPWSLALGLLGIATWLWYFLSDRRAHADDERTQRVGAATPATGGRRAVGLTLALLAFGLGGVASYQTVLIGESGTRAVWEGVFTESPR